MDRCPTCGRRKRRSSESNRLYWALLHKMAEREWGGQRYSAETMHAYYKSRFLGCDDVRLPNGKVLTIPRSTADLDSADFSAYYAQVEADCAERGVFLDEK